jgi:hypothetical protein
VKERNMNPEKIAKYAEKVAKLLRQAEDVAGTPEEGVFQARAFEIMAKYGIAEAMVRARRHGLDTADISGAVEHIFDITGTYANAQMLLLAGMGRSLHCKGVYRGLRGGGIQLYLYGMPDHIERVKFLWGLLGPQAVRLAGIVRPAGDSVSPGYVTVYRRSWMAGFANAIETRILEQENKIIEGVSGALVLYKNDEQRAEDARKRRFPSLRDARRSSRRMDFSAYLHGQRDGRSASFNRTIGPLKERPQQLSLFEAQP